MAQYEYGNRVIDGKTIAITEVPKLLRKSAEWACTCPVCAEPFVAAMGEHNQDHFRHKNKKFDFVCDVHHVNQTGLHKRAKEVIQEARRFHLPAYTIDRSEIDFGDLPPYVVMSLPEQYTYHRERWIQCHKVELEKRISDIIPDVVAYTPEGEYLIEIYVTNPIGPGKILKAEKIGLPLLEVDLSDLKDKPISEDDLRKAVIYSCDRTEWRYFPERDRALEAARAYYLEHKNVKAYRERQELLRRQREAEEAAKAEKQRLTQEQLKNALAAEENPVTAQPGLLDPLPFQDEIQKTPQQIYDDGYEEVKNRNFGKNNQIWDSFNHRWLRCWACGNIRRSDEMVMYQWARGLCGSCHYEKHIAPEWK